jgi:hypothetical protein
VETGGQRLLEPSPELLRGVKGDVGLGEAGACVLLA